MTSYSLTGTPTVIDAGTSASAAISNTGSVPLLVVAAEYSKQIGAGGSATVPCWSAVRTTMQTAGPAGSADVTLTPGTPAARPGPGAVTFDPGAAGSMTLSITGGTWYTDEGLTTAATFPRTVAAVTSLYPAAPVNATIAATVGTATQTRGIRVDFGGDESYRWEPTSSAEAAQTTIKAGTALFGQTWATPAASTTLTGTLAAWTVTAVDCTAGAGARTLPAANSVPAGTAVQAKKVDTSSNALTIGRAGSDLIYGTGAGATSKVLTLPGEAVELVSDGTSKWTVRLSDTPSSALFDTFAAQAVTVDYTTTTAGVATPTGFKFAEISLISGGSAGGSGRRGAAGTACGGGASGSSPGVLHRFRVPAAAFGATYSMTVGAPGTGGAAVTVDDTNGNAGTAAGSTIFTTGTITLTASAGAPGGGGTTSGGTGGTGGAPGLGVTGAAGGAGAAGANGAAENRLQASVCSAGGGGGISSGNVAYGGGNGAATVVPASSAPAGGVVDGAVPASASAAAATAVGAPGPSAGGGAASVTTAAQAGANGLGYGSPGGGGGASRNGSDSGKGGDGGPGFARIVFIH